MEKKPSAGRKGDPRVKMKRVALLALALIWLMSAAGLAGSSPVIYRVTDGEGHVLYLMGTIHMGSEDMFPLGGAFEEAWRESELLAVECDTLAMENNIFWTLKSARALMLGLGDSAENHLSEETYALGQAVLGQPRIVLDRLCPMAWISLADAEAMLWAGYDPSMSVEAALLGRAREEGRQVIELEGGDAQMALFGAVPDEAADYQLREILGNMGAEALGLRVMADAWSRGDAAALERMIRQSREIRPEGLEEAFEAYDRLMFADRNDGFAAQAAEWLASGRTVLIAVGTAHVIGGEDSVTRQLLDAGYTVERIGQ